MKETIFLQNIISPYRANFFNSLKKEYDNFAVYYMGETEPDKFWDVSKVHMDYAHWVDHHGYYFMPSKTFGTHCNPRLVWKILTSRNVKNIIFAVSWTDINIMTIALLKKLHLTNKRIFFWAEANHTAAWTEKHNSKLKWWLKRMVFSSVDGAMVIPGKMAEVTFEKWDIPMGNVIYLPNAINSNGLTYQNDGQRENNLLPKFIMPIRLIERVKGAKNFFDAIGEENIRKAIFYVAGDGVDKQMYIDYVKEHHYEDNIKILGFCSTEKMRELFNEVSVFVLPSFSDPSPLSLIEGLNFHLPILCSNHCGNHYEAVEDGVNGYTFSPLNPSEIKDKFEKIMERRDEWTKMGEQSSVLYKERFDTEKIVKNFVKQFNKVKK